MSQDHESVELVPELTVQHVALAVLLAALTAALAQVSIPVPGIPVPFSLQPFAVFLAGLLLGPLWGGFALGLYLLVGIAGAPVFSNGGAGLGYVLGPTGGFLVGFLLAGVLIGAIVHRDVEPRSLDAVSVPVMVLALALGLVVVYAVGIPWLALVNGISFAAAGTAMAPFVLPDLLKAGITVALVAGGAEAYQAGGLGE
jgi:biotin transport system substrate-specific component